MCPIVLLIIIDKCVIQVRLINLLAKVDKQGICLSPTYL